MDFTNKGVHFESKPVMRVLRNAIQELYQMHINMCEALLSVSNKLFTAADTSPEAAIVAYKRYACAMKVSVVFAHCGRATNTSVNYMRLSPPLMGQKQCTREP